MTTVASRSLSHLGDPMQAAILLVEAARNHIVSAIDEGKRKLPDPVHYLAPVLAWTILYNINLRDPGILQKEELL